jgi:hypothetical protein
MRFSENFIRVQRQIPGQVIPRRNKCENVLNGCRNKQIRKTEIILLMIKSTSTILGDLTYLTQVDTSMCKSLPKHGAVKTHRGVEVKSQAFLTSAPDGGATLLAVLPPKEIWCSWVRDSGGT